MKKMAYRQYSDADKAAAPASKSPDNSQIQPISTMKEQSELTTRQGKALIALLETGSVRRAAKACGMGETSLYRWMSDPDFQAAFRAARRQVVEATLSQLQTDSARAAEILLEIAGDANSAPAARVSACRTIISQAVDAVALVDLQERVDGLERIAKGGKK